ncbi:AAA family ATPase [Sphingobium sp. WTD-1]|uniref:AAA family ATPase n=1 Tax=Sphingobium sp. WTD-1 TaxID=2979467 RepID=UPI0024DEA85E|nr:AAA family ATPase [Sphingobium sp. WTD-1]WIA57633.1 AAA family ATPase [Sphingobium sp. WTD-1]
MTLAQDITRHFNGDWRRDQGFIPTPGNSAKDRGTTVRDTDDGDVVFHSFNGGDWKAIKDECRAKGLLPERQRLPDQWRVTGTYEFADADGSVLYRTVRKEHPAKPKRFEAQRPNGKGGWLNKLGDCPRVIYRYPEIKAAIGKAAVTDEPMPTVYLVEGERKADKLAGWGFLATAVAFGAQGWRRSYAEALERCNVIILPDNDDVGRAFAQKASADLEAAGCSVRIIDLPGLPPKGDIMDWTGSADDLRALVSEVPALVDADDWPELDLAVCAKSKAPEREWLVDGWIPANKATLLAGDGGVGKSLLAQIKATCVALGRPFMGMPTRQANAAYLSWEDDADELWRRQEAICDVMAIPLAQLAGKLSLVSYTEEENPFLVTADETGVRVSPLGRKIERLTERRDIALLILDNASQIAGIDHNAVDEVAPFAHWLGTLAKRRNGAVVLLHHTNKAGQDYLGSVAYNNQFRSRMLLARPDECHDPDVRILTNPKANYAQAGNGVELRWFKGAFIRDEDLPESQRAELADVGIANVENARFLECLEASTRDKQAVSHHNGTNYAPTIFARMPEAKGMTAKGFERAMQRLRSLQKIKFDQPLWKGANRVMKQGIKLADGLAESAPTPASTPRITPCTDLHEPPAQVIENIAPTPHALTPLYTTYKSGAAAEAGAPVEDDGLDESGDIIGWNDKPHGGR